MEEPQQSAPERALRLRDIPLALLAPRRAFARVEDVAAYAWPLIVLLTCVTLVGYATVQTGLIDHVVDAKVAERNAEIEAEQRDVVERSELRELYQQEEKKGDFEKLLVRIQVVVAQPLTALVSVLLIAAVLYGAVALTGRKPEWHTLLTICVFAGFIDVLRLLTTLALTLHYRTLEVNTSLALLTQIVPTGEGVDPAILAALSGLLSGLDPFRLWFWLLVTVGLSVTAQLPGWRAWATCTLCWLLAAGTRCALAVAIVQNTATAAARSS